MQHQRSRPASMRRLRSWLLLLLLTFCLCVAVQSASLAQAGPLSGEHHSALGSPVEVGAPSRCPATLGVFVRQDAEARFVADAYGVHVNVRFSEITEVLSGLLNGRRAYVFVTHTYPDAQAVRSSSWRDSYYPRHPSEGPAVSAISVPVGPLRGNWTLAECRHLVEP